METGWVDTGDLATVFSTIADLKRNISSSIRGKDEEIEFLLTSVIAGESILIQDVPGVGKTTLAKALAASLDLDFQRVQCTPDLMPADVFGVSIFNPQTAEFSFRKGPVFTNILLVDEINRATPRTQSALLEAMAEGQVTIDGTTHALQSPFMVIATENPIGYHGTFPLPESQLDRFALQISLDYPDRETELELLYSESDLSRISELEIVLSFEDVLKLQQLLSAITFNRSLANYLLTIVERTRNHPHIELGCSPRGAISYFKCARAYAMIQGRDFVLPDDIQCLASRMLRHRLVVNNRHLSGSNEDVIQLIDEIVGEVNVPV